MLIYTGRFQPIHNGHLNLLRQILEEYPDELVVVAVIEKARLKEEDKNHFDLKVDREWNKKGFMFDPEENLKIICEILEEEFAGRVLVLRLPRPSKQNWQEVTELFNSDRTWVFTQNEESLDEWEEAKVKFYESQGDKVLRIKIKSKDINGSDIRHFIENNEYEKLKGLVPEKEYEYIIANSKSLSGN